ncbi:MAG TPA: HD domain-containing protein [Candidatus Saccharimonadia bacterium]
MDDEPAARNRDVELIYEMGTARYIQRTWRQFLNPDFANLAEHHFRVAWIAMVIARHEGGVDLEKLLKLALVHDIYETRTGDVHYLSRVYSTRDKLGAFTDIFTGTILEDDFLALRDDYDERRSLEAKIVKDADNLDVDVELNEQSARGHHGIRSSKEEMRQHVGATQLYTETARRLFHELRAADPHAWHRNANNRFTVGEWKIEPPPTDSASNTKPADGYQLSYKVE